MCITSHASALSSMPDIDVAWEHIPAFHLQRVCGNIPGHSVGCQQHYGEVLHDGFGHLMKGKTVYNCTYNHKQVDKFIIISV